MLEANRMSRAGSKGFKTEDASTCRLAPGSQVRVGGGPRGKGWIGEAGRRVQAAYSLVGAGF